MTVASIWRRGGGGRLVVLAVVLTVAGLYHFFTSRPPSGAQSRRLEVGGVERSYVLYAPARLSPRPALLIVLHGMGGSGVSIERRTRRTFDALAARAGFVVVYPDGLGRKWNSGHPWVSSESDDVAFIEALIAALSVEFSLDAKRVFVTGLSNGAAMAYRLACERPNLVAAIAPVAGGLSQTLMPKCPAGRTRPIPLLLMHGTADPIAPFDSGELEGNVWQWVERNGCQRPASVSRAPDVDPRDGARARIEHYGSCKAGADVVLYAIEGGGHHWPGGDEPWRGGNECRDFDAGEIIWKFFERHPMP